MSRVALVWVWLAGLQEPPPIRVPEGFVLERVAGPPLVERPIMACFDDRGRLYVSDSAGVNHKGSELLKDPPHRIRLLEDTDGDGIFDKSHVFADKLVFPQGLLWHEGAVYTTSPPGFWKLEDTDGDGICDKRTELVTGFANTGVADDAHGACLGPDGRIYFLPGRMAHDIKLPDGTRVRKAVGPWLMRCRPDGSDVEIISGCVGNPVEVDWLPEGDFFVSGTFWAPDSFGGGLRDALIHGVEGGEWAVRDRAYNDRKRTGDLLPVLVPMAATAPSGMMIYRSPGTFQGNLFATYFNTHKVQRHVLERDGATFRAKTEEFVSSPHADFHPTDVLEDADGSVLVVDTGGWFRIGCPTSQIAKPQVLGGIYRIRRKDAPKVEDPRGFKIDWSKPSSDRLGDRRFAVRERAIRELAKGDVRIGLLQGSPEIRRNALWAVARKGTKGACDLATPLLEDSDPTVRQVAATVLGLQRHREGLEPLCRRVAHDLPQVRREAATALGRIGDKRAVPAILESLRLGADRYLEHALFFALIRIADREGMVQALRDPSPVVRRAALVALDQMEGGALTPDLVTPLLDPTDAPLQQAALRVITSRPAWSKEILGLAARWMREEAPQELLRGVVVSFAREAALQDLVAFALRDKATTVATRLLILESMARAALDRTPATWAAETRWALDDADERVVRQAVATLRACGVAEFSEQLLGLARDAGRPAELRAEALAAAAPSKLDPSLFTFLTGCLDREKPPLLRLSAAEALGRAGLDDGQLEALTRIVAKAGPIEMPRLAGAFERSKNAGVGKKLIAALGSSPGFASLSPETLGRAIRQFPDEVRKEAAPLFKKLDVDLDQQKAKIAELEPVLKGGDAARGREVFQGRKAGCTACHTVLGQGAKGGPDLTKIGSIRAPRDLLEAVVFPSATFARGYEPFLVRTKDGAIVDGLIARETADAIYLFTSERVEKRIARASVDEIRQSRLSVMPQGLDGQLTRDELRDLIAYLASLR